LHPSFADARFVLVIVDEFSNKVWTFPLKQKGDSAETIQVWAEQMKHQMGTMPKEFHTDNGGEFDNKTLLDFWQQHGVKHTFTPPYTPQHNGTVERMNRTLVTVVRTLLARAGAPKKLWAEAL